MGNKFGNVGQLWNSTTRDGLPYFSGTVWLDGVEMKIAVFPNTNKKHSKQPDFVIYANEREIAKVEDIIHADS